MIMLRVLSKMERGAWLVRAYVWPRWYPLLGCKFPPHLLNQPSPTLLLLLADTASSTGPFAAVAWLACLGGCSETGLKVFNNCQAAKGNDVRLSFNPIQLGDKKRRTVTESVNPCINVKEYTFDCPAMESGLLSHFECQQTGASSSSGSNGINV